MADELILIVDDHPSFCAVARTVLEAEGFTVVGTAQDGASGVAEALQGLHDAGARFTVVTEERGIIDFGDPGVLVDAAAPACVACKPQLACFERLGAPGWAALTEVCAAASRNTAVCT